MSDASTPTRSHVEAAFDRVTSTLFIFAVLAVVSAVVLIGPMEAMERLAAVSRHVLRAFDLSWLPRLL